MSLRADQIVSGFAINFLALGVTGYVFLHHYGEEGTPDGVPQVPDVSLPIDWIPFFGPALEKLNLLVWVALVLVLVLGVWLFVFRTPAGLRLRSVGENPRAAATVGISVYVDHQRRHAAELRATDAVASEPAGAGAPELPPSLLLSGLQSGLLRNLPQEQRDAIAAHVLQGQDYADIASASGTSEPSVRQRVSRGLRALRAPLEVYRAAQDLAREGRAYRFGAGHGTALTSIDPRAPLDCSSAASLILQHGGVFDSCTAWTSNRLADRWGAAGEGRYVTVWANDEHVWLEFKLDADHGERFDPTPSHLAPNAGWLSRRNGPTFDYTPRHWPGL